MIIADLMTSVLASVAPKNTLFSAVALMRDKRCSCVLVTDKGYPKGILTERDVVRLFDDAIKSQQLENILIEQVMTPDPVSVSVSTTLYDALLLVRTRKLRHLLVVDEEGLLVGLVTQTDMVNVYMQLIQRQTELETENQQLHLLSHKDALMGIGNRRAMEVELAFTEAASRRYKKPYAVALIDVDFFKCYNDHYGHQSGDDALSFIATAITDSMRETDRLYRYGGEEILMLMPETETGEALVAAERARESVLAMQLPHTESKFGYLTVSIGIAAAESEAWTKLVKRADVALYRAKGAGRNKVCSWSTTDS